MAQVLSERCHSASLPAEEKKRSKYIDPKFCSVQTKLLLLMVEINFFIRKMSLRLPLGWKERSKYINSTKPAAALTSSNTLLSTKPNLMTVVSLKDFFDDF